MVNEAEDSAAYVRYPLTIFHQPFAFRADPLVLRSRISADPGIRKFGIGPIS
jgi:hypothetical protein